MGKYISTLPENLKHLSDEEVDGRIKNAKKRLSDSLLILAHHYQRDEIVEHADITGDSFALAKAAVKSSAEYIVFCGVHFMAETADIITSNSQKVFMPDTSAGCFLADTANIEQVEKAWEEIHQITGEMVIPVTYINSDVSLKAFCGKNSGIVCTSSNAQAAIEWALNRGKKVFFFPDKHLGRNTAFRMGISLDKMIMWDYEKQNGRNSIDSVLQAQLILWNGYCNVHQEFRKEYVDCLKEKYPDIKIIVHPECNFDVVQSSDYVGSTAYIIKEVEEDASGTKWGIGTEKNLVNRLKRTYSDKLIMLLHEGEPTCDSMSQTAKFHLLYQLESLINGEFANQIVVGKVIKKDALIAIDRMLRL
jgi:quinolinate synthase